MTACRDGVPVLRSKDAAHTAELVGYLCTKLREGALDGGTSAGGGYTALLCKKRKRDNLSSETTWRMMLTQVPGMSAHKAAVVAAAYPSLSALAAAGERELAAVQVPPAAAGAAASPTAKTGRKARRLGPTVAKRLAALA